MTRRSFVQLAHDRRGSGDPLVLLHPLGADRQVWDPVLERLAARRQLLVVDLPGFGGSPALPSGYAPTPAHLAEAIALWLAALGIDRPHVAGNSLGGWVALELARNGLARSVAAIAPAGLWPEPLAPKRGVPRGLARRSLPLICPLVNTRRGRRLVLAGVVAHPERVPPRAAQHLLRSYATAPGFQSVNAAMRARRFTALEDIRVPVTLAWPEHDRLVSRPRHLAPGVRNVSLPGCGHVPMWDEPARVADLLLEASAG